MPTLLVGGEDSLLDYTEVIERTAAAIPAARVGWVPGGHLVDPAHPVGAPPLAAGSRLAFVASFLGRRLAYTYEVAELVPGERLVMRTADGPFPMGTTYTWEDAPGGGTRMTLRNRGEPAGFAKVAAPALAGAMRRANRKDLARLKQILEARAT